MEPQAFALLMARFDTIEAQNEAQLKFIEAHISDDAKTKEIVDRHTTYFSLMSLGSAPLLAYVVHKFGWK